MSSLIDTISDTKRRLRNTRIALLALGIFVVFDFFASLSIYSENQELTAASNSQAARINELYNELELRTLQLQKYEADEEYIKSLGATPDQAKKIIKASEALNVSPKS